MRNDKALVILSGGQDSTTCLFWAAKEFSEVHAITFDYGQRHHIEIEAAEIVADMAGVISHEVVVVDCLKSTSPLLSDNELERYSDFSQMDQVIGNRVELTFVPMRNTLFLTIAMNRAIALGCDNLVTGICQEDNANYPDCTEAFRQSFEYMANLSLGTVQLEDGKLVGEMRFQVHAPLMFLSKADTVRLASTMPECWAALAYSHTSYDGKYPPVDMNHSNVLRAHGFEEAGLPDPLVVRAVNEGLMSWPASKNYDKIAGRVAIEYKGEENGQDAG